MPFAELSAVKHRVHLGAPLPFNVRNADHTLLLARGHLVESREQLDALFKRGALVDIAELQSPRDEILQAPRSLLPELWTQAMSRLGGALRTAAGPGFRDALAEAAEPVQSLVERDPDLAIFQVLRQGAGADLEYGAQRSLQTAITSLLVAQRMGWEPVDAERAFKVALTMNLSMLELQGELARQTTAPSPEQRSQLQTHPMRSVRMLETAGIADADWLRAVLQHHENEDGSGYPSGTSTVGQLASLVRRSDVYTSKLSSRSSRDAMAADMAGRQMFMQDPGHPMTAALVKEFGIYPPGCHVRLASGELAVVVARGETITAPIVACLTNERGAALALPVRRDTAEKAHAIAGVVGERSVGTRQPLDRLMAALAA
jgi:HD-GYP domain-containing protein (c-di-GMP phosphodiesterase class II)